MKKTLIPLLFGVIGLLASAQGSMTFTTNAPVGTSFRFLPNVKSATTPITVDYGNGVEVKYTVKPDDPAWSRWIDGSVEGSYIKVSGSVTEFELKELQLTSAVIDGMSNLQELNLAKNELETFELTGYTPLKTLNLSDNKIYNSPGEPNKTLTLENAAETLTTLTLTRNTGLQCLDMSSLLALEYLYINECPDFGSLFICLPEDSRPALKQINLSNCSLAHFYPVNLPNLTQLNLANNQLMSSAADDNPFVLGNYPKLHSLDVSNNSDLQNLDITACKELESLNISGNKFESIDVSQAPGLLTLSAGNNLIKVLDLGNNKLISTLNVSNNPISELNVKALPSIRSLNISNTNISRVDLMDAYYMDEFRASNTRLEFVDFNGLQANRMRIIDLSNNSLMTSESVDYTVHTLPVAKSSSNGSPNLLLSGSNGEHADISYATGIDMGWICDITGDGTAKHDMIPVTLSGATDTGENKTGRVDRLYPFFGMSLDYDFDIYETVGGKFLISQWKPMYYQSMMSVTTEARVGVPIHIYPYPEDGKRFKSVTVNGKEIFSQWFMLPQGASSGEIKVNFTSEEPSISFTTKPGQSLSFLLNTATNNGTVYVDWGTGTRMEYPGQRSYTSGYTEIKGTRIDGSAAGETITIYGDVTALDISGFGDAAEIFGLWDNAVTSINLSNAADMKFLSVYWNPISTIDLSSVPNLEVLNIGYTDMTSVDLSNNSNIMWLEAYSDGFGEDGISQLTEIDVTNMPYLQYLDVKSNKIASIDLSQNKYLLWAKLNNNELTEIDLSENTNLEELNLADNKLTEVDLSNNTELIDLSLADNLLTDVDLTDNTQLRILSIANNDIHFADFSVLTELRRLYINGNGMSACELNDIYYLLPQRKPVTDEDETLDNNLFVIQGGDKVENEGTRADSGIAVDRGWTPSHLGANGGCDFAYLDILPSTHGSVIVKDADGNEYGNGSKVPKYIPLSIVATAEDGYKLATFSLNGEEAQSGTSFEMPGIYTKLSVVFTKSSGIDEARTDGVVISTADGKITVATSSEATVNIYTAAGVKIIDSAAVNGTRIFDVTPGYYIIRVTNADGVTTESLVVK